MNAALAAALGLGCFALGYKKYSSFLEAQVFETNDPQFRTAAHEREDGVDFVPTPESVLLGHHFTSIAGLAPLVGPAVAVIWGWLPALLWIVFGTIFLGAVHDYGCLALSAKNGANSVADLTGDILGDRARILFLTLVFFLTWIVIAVFGFVIAKLFVLYPATVIPVNAEILVALGIGWWVHKRKGSLLVPSLLALVLLYVLVYVGTLYPVSISDLVPASLQNFLGGEIQVWLAYLLSYAFLASLMPVWLLLQPRDYINSHQLAVGLGGLYLALFLFRPEIQAPALVTHPEGASPLFPFLFVTIACGAISGFHGLVGSGTTSKQLDQLPSARKIGYGSTLGEGCVALLATLACTAGFPSSEAWHAHYGSWNAANGLSAKLAALVGGGAYFFEQGLSIPTPVGEAVVAVLVISFGATTLDSATRIQRYIIQELGTATGFSPATKPWIAAGLAAFLPVLLLQKNYWTKLWPIFGASNQLLAAMSLVVLSAYLVQRKKPAWPVLGPMIYVSGVTVLALILQALGHFRSQNWLLFGLTVVMTVLGIWVLIEGHRARGREPAKGIR